MNCIITCGPAYEPLDEVRRLTNFSTGRLGVEFSNYLVEHGVKVTLLKGESASYPGNSEAQEQISFQTGADLENKLRELSGKNCSAVFHAAAVSDFRFGKVFKKTDAGTLTEAASAKFTTREMPLFVELVATPKILPRLKDWFPDALIVGWKYEVEGGRDTALAKGGVQLAEAKVDFTVVNGPAYDQGFAVVGGGEIHNCTTRPELYQALFRLLSREKHN